LPSPSNSRKSTQRDRMVCSGSNQPLCRYFAQNLRQFATLLSMSIMNGYLMTSVV